MAMSAASLQATPSLSSSPSQTALRPSWLSVGSSVKDSYRSPSIASSAPSFSGGGQGGGFGGDRAAISAQQAAQISAQVAAPLASSTQQATDSSAVAQSDYEKYLAEIKQMAAQNTAASASQAEALRKWQEIQNAKAMEFNAAEAAKNRDWQKMMSDTAHQREIKDLQAAGLNPVLSAMGGQGAAVTSGATASGVTSSGAKGDVDTSASSAMVSLLGSLLHSQTTLLAQAMSARSNEAIADRSNATSKFIAELTSSTTKSVQSAREAHDIYMAQNYPSGLYGLITALSEAISGRSLGSYKSIDQLLFEKVKK